MSQLSHSDNFDGHRYSMDPFSLVNEGSQGQLDQNQFSAKAPGVYPSINRVKIAPVLSTARSANMTQYPATVIRNFQRDLFTIDQESSELSSELNDGLFRYPRSYQQDFSGPLEQTPISSLLSSTNPSAIINTSHSQIKPKSHTPLGEAKRKLAVWSSEEVRPIEGKLVLALLFKYMPKPTVEDMENISNDTGYPLEFVIDFYCQNRNSSRANGIIPGNNATVGHLISKAGLPEAHNLSNTRDSAYGLQIERQNFVQPVKRTRVQKDPSLPAPQAVDGSFQKKVYRCGLCIASFAREADFRRHMEAMHCLNPGGDMSPRKEQMNNHYKRKHRDSSSSAPQMPVLRYDDPENGLDSGNHPGSGHLFGGGGNSWQSSQSGSTSMNSGWSAPRGSSYMRHTFENRFKEKKRRRLGTPGQRKLNRY